MRIITLPFRGDFYSFSIKLTDNDNLIIEIQGVQEK